MKGRSASLTVRLTPELRDRLELARSAHAYAPTVTAIVERGIEMALEEMDAHGVSSRLLRHQRALKK